MKTTKQFADELYSKWGLTVTSEYTGAHKVINFNCAEGHSNEAAATNVLQRGYKCKECLTGRTIVSKLNWDTQFSDVLQFLSYNTTEDTAVKFSTTVSAINNQLAKRGISNPKERITEISLIEALLLQNRELIEMKGPTAKVSCAKGHIHIQEASNIISHNTGCPSCFSLGTSRMESEVIEFISSIYSNEIITKDRTILQGKEIDIVLPDVGVCIEFNGTYWHREDKVGRTYHKNKTEGVEAIEYQLLHIKDYDWATKQNIVKSIIKSKLNLTIKIVARKCVIKQVDFPRDFLNTNHIQGAGQPTSNNYGLFFKEELVAVATFAKPRFSDEADYELVRFCSKLGYTIVGGLSKLLNPIKGSILSYASRDYSNGKGYKAVGFTQFRVTEPGLEYYYKYEKVSRYKAQSMSVEELSKYHKYYNAGNLVFIKPYR